MTNQPLTRTLFVSDMDGTLMGGDSRVSARSVAIINNLVDHHGLLFTVATARTTATAVGGGAVASVAAAADLALWPVAVGDPAGV